MATSPVSPKIRVLCVDDSADIADTLGRCIDAEPDMESAGCLRAADNLAAEVKNARADVVLLDMKMPGKDPLAALREVASSARFGEGARVIVYSGSDNQAVIDRAVNAGAWGYVSKDAEIPRVLDAIRQVARGTVVFGSG